jgi:hypothetical protein
MRGLGKVGGVNKSSTSDVCPVGMELKSLTPTRPETLVQDDLLVGTMAEPQPELPIDAQMSEILELALEDDRNDWLVLVDGLGCPVRLVERAAMLRAEPFEHRVLTVAGEEPVSVAVKRAQLRPQPERLRPLVCCDENGRYVGVVRIERLLAALVG